MKIAFLHGENQFTRQMLSAVQAALPSHHLSSWIKGTPPPSPDIELLISLSPVTKEIISENPQLNFIQTASTGYETVDIDAATQAGIWVSFAPSDVTGNATSVAEFAILLILGASRHLSDFIQPPRNPQAKPSLLHPALHGKHVCIIGLGAIGDQIVDRLRPFGVTITATDEHPDKAPQGVEAFPPDQLKTAIADADYVVLCVRASKETEGLIDASVLAAMKHGAILINIARGTLIDEAALAASLSSGQISAVGLDVLQQEPPDPRNPLLAFSQALVTPHIAGFTDIMLQGTVDYIAKVVEQVSSGKKPDSVLNNPQTPRLPLTS